MPSTSRNVFPLKASPETLQCLADGIQGYAHQQFGPCSLMLSDGTPLEVGVIGKDFAPRFECFSLALEIQRPARTATFTPFEIARPAAVSVLLREEYTEPFTGDPSSLLGRNPMNQTAALPGSVPEHAFDSCLVAYGLVIENDDQALAVVADWAPFKIEVATHRTRVRELKALSEVVQVADYVRRLAH